MHKKISVGLSVTIAVITLVITAIITTAVTMNIYTELVADLPQRENMYAELAEIDNIIRTNYYGTAEQTSVNNNIVNGYLDTLSNGANYRMTEKEYTDYKLKISGKDSAGKAVASITTQKYNGVGYIKILDFTDSTYSEFKTATDKFIAETVNGVIIDVRDTNSINIDSAAKIIDYIVPLATGGTNAIATATDKNGKTKQVFAADSQSISTPIAVLINENTNGAGELIACDIRDFGKGTITGTTTAGNGTLQQIFELSDGGALVLTVAKLLPYKSDCYEGVGVKPDYEVKQTQNTTELKNDKQFLQAFAAVSIQK